MKTLAFALIVVSGGQVQDDRTTYYAKLDACRWYAQMINRKQKYFRPVEKSYCESAWIDLDKISPINLKVIPKPVEETEE